MALVTELNALTHEIYLPGIADQLAERRPLLEWALKNMKKVGVGTFPHKALRYKRTNANRTAGLDPLTVTHTPVHTAAVSSFWGKYHTACMITGDELSDSGAGAIVVKDISKAKWDESVDALRDLMSQDLYSASAAAVSSKGFLGVAAMTDNASTNFLGIDGVAETWWQADADTGSLTGDIPKYISDQSLDIRDNKGDVTMAVTTATVWKEIRAQLQPQDRRIITQSEIKYRTGARAIEVEMIPVWHDLDCTASVIYLLSTDDLEFQVKSDYNFKVRPWREVEGQDANVQHIFFRGFLMCARRKTQGKITLS